MELRLSVPIVAGVFMIFLSLVALVGALRYQILIKDRFIQKDLKEKPLPAYLLSLLLLIIGLVYLMMDRDILPLFLLPMRSVISWVLLIFGGLISLILIVRSSSDRKS